MGKRKQEGCENGDGGEKKQTRRVLRSQKVEDLSQLVWEWGKGKRGGKVMAVSTSGTQSEVKPKGKKVLKHEEFGKEIEGLSLMMCHECKRKDKVRLVCCLNCKKNGFCFLCIKLRYRNWSEFDIAESCPVCRGFCNCEACLPSDDILKNPGCGIEVGERMIHGREEVEELQAVDQQPARHPVEQCSTVQPLKNTGLSSENERHVGRDETGERQKGRGEETEVQPDEQFPARHPFRKCSIMQMPRVEETGGQEERIEQEEEVQAPEDDPSPPRAEWCSTNYSGSETEVGAPDEESESDEDEVHIIEVKQSNAKCSIQALGFLESYLEQQQGLCTSASTNEDSLPSLREVARAKINIMRISTQPIDEVMDPECLQSFKSSLDVLLKADDSDGTQSANIEHVLGKLALLESKYPTASKITDEVNEAHKRKLELEQEVEIYALSTSEAQKKESEILNQINVKKKKIAAEEAELRKLEQSFATQRTRMSEFNSAHEKFQQELKNCRVNENIWVKKALQAKKDFWSIEETMDQMQQLIPLICSWKEEAATP